MATWGKRESTDIVDWMNRRCKQRVATTGLQEEQADDFWMVVFSANGLMAIVFRSANQLETSIEENIAKEHVASTKQGKAMFLVQAERPTSTMTDHRLKP